MMAFGYSFLCGRQGAEGYIRDTNGKRSVIARGMMPGQTCFLYAVTENGITVYDRKTADAGGNAEFLAKGPGNLFIADGNAVRLWETDDSVYLRACAFLSAKDSKEEAKERLEKGILSDLPLNPVENAGGAY